MKAAQRVRFDWLAEDPYHLRGNLRAVRTAIRRGQFDGPSQAARRGALWEALVQLQSMGDALTPRARIALATVFLEIERRKMDIQEFSYGLRRTKHRKPVVPRDPR
jgi:hypothetical protein